MSYLVDTSISPIGEQTDFLVPLQFELSSNASAANTCRIEPIEFRLRHRPTAATRA